MEQHLLEEARESLCRASARMVGAVSPRRSASQAATERRGVEGAFDHAGAAGAVDAAEPEDDG
ncbi:MAG TPA: hypothetical protein VKA51_04430 [Rubrobacteraceae bacterium]|nr:hypothetical protein [Rubrobacteraceae bacterium]